MLTSCCGSISRYDIADAVNLVSRDSKIQGKHVVFQMRCAKTPGNVQDLAVMLFDASNFPHHGNVNTTVNGFLNGTTTFSSFPTVSITTSTMSLSKLTTSLSSTCELSILGKCLSPAHSG